MAINIDGANTLKLVVTDAGDGSSHDWAEWGNAYLSVDLIPVLSLDYESLTGGDGNGIFDPGETMDVHLKVENTGSASTGTLVSTCTAMGDNSSFVTVNNLTVDLNALTPGSLSTYTHSISIDPSATSTAQNPVVTYNTAGTDIVDWILIDLRDTTSADMATSSTSIGMHAAFLRNDGRVVDLDGNPVLSFANTMVKNDLFVVVFSESYSRHFGKCRNKNRK